MIIKRLKNLRQFTAGDDSKLKEILNPRKEKLKVSYSLAYAKVGKNKKTLRHRLKYSEVYFILKGTGVMHIDNEKKVVKAGDTIYIPPYSIQFIENKGKTSLEFLCIVDPAWEPDCEEVLE
ncbi:MAG: cupin domain-containing protein [candidate division WOR-3 bacterium]|nr:cupin domain-containing protein [candidate division WOR-3 bacterium]